MTRIAGAVLLAAAVATGCVSNARMSSVSDVVSDHMIAEATLTAHYVDAALQAGMTAEEINAALSRIAAQTVIDEFWISDADGRIAFTNVPGTEFAFPTDPGAGTQAAPFAVLLSGDAAVVAQGTQPRELDGMPFKYVAVAGADQPRIVQVGVAGTSAGH